jgi:hypothetical protein
MSPVYELSCAEVHAVRCDVRLRSADPAHVLDQAREHGEAHAFTAAWYTPKRLAAMAAQVTKRPA